MTQIATLIQDIEDYLRDATSLCERGAFVDLAGFDARVATLCASVQALPLAQAKAHAADLDRLMLALEALELLMHEKRRGLADELNESSRHHKAAKAYTQSELSAPAQAAEQP